MNLEEEIKALAAQVKAASQSAELVHQEQARLGDLLAALGRSVDPASAEVAHRIDEAKARAARRAEVIQRETAHTVAALRTLKAKIVELTEHVDADVEKATAHVTSLVTRTQELQGELDAKRDHVATVLGALQEKAEHVASQVTQAADEHHDHVAGDMHAATTRVQEGVDQKSSHVDAHVREHVAHKVAHHAGRVKPTLADGAHRTGESLRHAHEAAEEHRGQIRKHSRAHVQVTIASTTAKVEEVTRLIHALGELVRVTGSTIATTKDAVATGAEATNAGLNVSLGILRELRELFGHFV